MSWLDQCFNEQYRWGTKSNQLRYLEARRLEGSNPKIKDIYNSFSSGLNDWRIGHLNQLQTWPNLLLIVTKTGRCARHFKELSAEKKHQNYAHLLDQVKKHIMCSGPFKGIVWRFDHLPLKTFASLLLCFLFKPNWTWHGKEHYNKIIGIYKKKYIYIFTHIMCTFTVLDLIFWNKLKYVYQRNDTRQYLTNQML